MSSHDSHSVVRLRDALGCSEVVTRICRQVTRVATSDFAVLISGETGTGKELVARVIHAASPRATAPFVVVDCGAIPEATFESELFGPDAASEEAHRGTLAAAAGGTVFLDDIPKVPPVCQARLLRTLQERVVDPAAANGARCVDVRVIAAVNVDLDGLVGSGHFRRDLFFRLTEFVIHIPPLRERREDIAFLAQRFVEVTNRELHKSVMGISEGALQRLLAYEWPGNARQLRATLRRAVLLADTVVDEEHLGLPAADAPRVWVVGGGMPLKQLVRQATVDVERAALTRALAESGGNKSQAARLLQIDSKTMRTKLKEYGIAVRGRRTP